ncbi:MAG: bifunctional diaminohydroxyphosphoribosylaminopyrimidine deaminase/5-amino-6-(5-phosphoribosylamino)uracil reductase RibD [Bacteroidales bacterium]|nr:bifunctional diaminohydroxyphosphoribosylaminopyrimidine deaminase/5-amino-6-(5-phosphoribosylamino)uracil reductase RibD [Bacteroidales bacterium]
MTNRTLHEKYMQRCIDLAGLGLGNTAPNPMVGSIIVYNNNIIGEGYHTKNGEAHAEVNAIDSVTDKSLLSKSTLYVNLEPCSHYGKTPPCANLISNLGIPNVIIGTVDTASHVSGNGIKILKESGCKVTTRVLEKESRELNKRFFTFHEKNRPYVILKWAQTKDGFIDIERGYESSERPTWITNEYAKKLVHKWRSEEQSILVGTNTVLADNPELTTRNWKGHNPLRVILDRNLKLDNKQSVFNSNAETLVIADNSTKTLRNKYLNSNVGIEFVDYSNNFYHQLFDILHNKRIQSIIVEGGEKVLSSFIRNNIWDEARIFYGNNQFNKGVNAPNIGVKELKRERLGGAKLTFIKNTDTFNQ